MGSKQKSNRSGIAGWPADERPRERLLSRGPHALTDAELLAILLHVGVPGKSAVELGWELLKRFGSVQGMLAAPLSAWDGIKGLGTAKLAQHLEQVGSLLRYKFNFLTERNFNKFFQELREGRIANYRSELDVKLAEEG